eukprot:443596-Karenia_brevis.AAC.1
METSNCQVVDVLSPHGRQPACQSVNLSTCKPVKPSMRQPVDFLTPSQHTFSTQDWPFAAPPVSSEDNG